MEPETTADKKAPIAGDSIIGPAPHTIRTYASDLAEVMREKQGSVVKIALAEERRREQDAVNVSPTSKKNLLFIGGAIALVVVGGGILFLASRQSPQTVPIVETSGVLPSFVATDSDKTIDISGMDAGSIGLALAGEVTSSTPKLNTIERIILVETPTGGTRRLVTTARLFEALGSNMPKSLLRSFDQYPTIGVHAFDGNDLFLLLHTSAYTTAFSGMLEWEPSLFDDVYRMFGITTIGDRADLGSTKWTDKVIKNQDARVLLDQQGKGALYYTFLGEDKSILLVTTKESTLAEVLNRLSAPRAAR